jgi:hypothetical protein
MIGRIIPLGLPRICKRIIDVDARPLAGYMQPF